MFIPSLSQHLLMTSVLKDEAIPTAGYSGVRGFIAGRRVVAIPDHRTALAARNDVGLSRSASPSRTLKRRLTRGRKLQRTY